MNNSNKRPFTAFLPRLRNWPQVKSRVPPFRLIMPHLIALLVFIAVACLYCLPSFHNKVLYQEDVLQWQGMAHNSFQYKETHGHFPLWSNGMFGGMPAFQIAMDSRSISIPNLFYGLITLYLPKPANFFFLACISFYLLSYILRTNRYIGIIGSLAYAYATYNAVIVSVGHDTKMESIAILPAVVASLILICEKKYWTGMVLTALFAALMISFGHMQIVYYTLLLAVAMFLGYAISWVRQKDFRRLTRTAASALGAGLIGILTNAVTLFTTFDSSSQTTRGGSELADKQSSYTSSGFSEGAAFDFSMYRTEPLAMLVPDIYGGSSDLELPGQRSRAVRALDSLAPAIGAIVGESGPHYYWGGTGELSSGPPYLGAVICFLAFLGFFILDNKHKWWILGACILAIAMSWGGYFPGFNRLLLKFLPMYDKFRAPSMILVIPGFLLCMLATLAMQKIFVRPGTALLWPDFIKGCLFTIAIFCLLFILYFFFGYSSPFDDALVKSAAGKDGNTLSQIQFYLSALRADRKMLFLDSILRSLFFIVPVAVLLGFYIRRKIGAGLMLAFVGTLSFADLIGMDLRYLNFSKYKEREDYTRNFQPTWADLRVLTDTGVYRVFDLRDSVSNALSYGAMTAYFHHSIGGYHAAKLKIYEDLINRQLYNNPDSSAVIDMLNTKYLIRPTASDGDTVFRNRGALGPAWLVKALRFEPGPREVMNALTRFHPKDTAILFLADKGKVNVDPAPDTSATIELIKNDNDIISYRYSSRTSRFAVFSEIFYDRGWKAWIDDTPVPIIRTNYVLRGLSVPAGSHIIRFSFHPLSYYLGRQVQWMASILFLLLLAGTLIVAFSGQFIHHREPLPSH
jgi:hypothetical protein